MGPPGIKRPVRSLEPSRFDFLKNANAQEADIPPRRQNRVIRRVSLTDWTRNTSATGSADDCLSIPSTESNGSITSHLADSPSSTSGRFQKSERRYFSESATGSPVQPGNGLVSSPRSFHTSSPRSFHAKSPLPAHTQSPRPNYANSISPQQPFDSQSFEEMAERLGAPLPSLDLSLKVGPPLFSNRLDAQPDELKSSNGQLATPPEEDDFDPMNSPQQSQQQTLTNVTNAWNSPLSSPSSSPGSPQLSLRKNRESQIPRNLSSRTLSSKRSTSKFMSKPLHNHVLTSVNNNNNSGERVVVKSDPIDNLASYSSLKRRDSLTSGKLTNSSNLNSPKLLNSPNITSSPKSPQSSKSSHSLKSLASLKSLKSLKSQKSLKSPSKPPTLQAASPISPEPSPLSPKASTIPTSPMSPKQPKTSASVTPKTPSPKKKRTATIDALSKQLPPLPNLPAEGTETAPSKRKPVPAPLLIKPFPQKGSSIPVSVNRMRKVDHKMSASSATIDRIYLESTSDSPPSPVPSSNELLPSADLVLPENDSRVFTPISPTTPIVDSATQSVRPQTSLSDHMDDESTGAPNNHHDEKDIESKTTTLDDDSNHVFEKVPGSYEVNPPFVFPEIIADLPCTPQFPTAAIRRHTPSLSQSTNTTAYISANASPAQVASEGSSTRDITAFADSEVKLEDDVFQRSTSLEFTEISVPEVSEGEVAEAFKIAEAGEPADVQSVSEAAELRHYSQSSMVSATPQVQNDDLSVPIPGEWPTDRLTVSASDDPPVEDMNNGHEINNENQETFTGADKGVQTKSVSSSQDVGFGGTSSSGDIVQQPVGGEDEKENGVSYLENDDIALEESKEPVEFRSEVSLIASESNTSHNASHPINEDAERRFNQASLTSVLSLSKSRSPRSSVSSTFSIDNSQKHSSNSAYSSYSSGSAYVNKMRESLMIHHRPQSPPSDAAIKRLSTVSFVDPDADREKKLKTKFNLIRELVSTEETFASDVQVIVDLYKRRLQTEKINQYITKTDIELLFGNIEQILMLSREFLGALRENIPSYVFEVDLSGHLEDVETNVGKVALLYSYQMEDQFKVYCRHNKRQMDTYCRFNALAGPTLDQWMKECVEQTRSMTTAWTLDSLLIKPVQRLLKYPLLLSSLMRATSPDNPDYDSLCSASKAFDECAERINDTEGTAEMTGDDANSPPPGYNGMLLGLKNNANADTELTALVEEFKMRRGQVRLLINGIREQTTCISNHFDSNGHLARSWLSCALSAFGEEEAIATESSKTFKRYKHYALFSAPFTSSSSTKMSTSYLTSRVEAEVICLLEKLCNTFDSTSLVIQERVRYHASYAKYVRSKAESKKSSEVVMDPAIKKQADLFLRYHIALKKDLPKFFDQAKMVADLCFGKFLHIEKEWFRIAADSLANVFNLRVNDIKDMVFQDGKEVDPIVEKFKQRRIRSDVEGKVQKIAICDPRSPTHSIYSDLGDEDDFFDEMSTVASPIPTRPSSEDSSDFNVRRKSSLLSLSNWQKIKKRSSAVDFVRQ